MTKQARGNAADQLRALALGYPETVEEFPWGHSAIKVRGKAFLFIGGEGEVLSVSCKLPASHGAALLLPFAAPTGYGLGKSGWVTASFAGGGKVLPLDILAEWVDESYRAIAPKKLAALVAERKVAGGTGAKEHVVKGRSEGAGAKTAAAKQAAGAPAKKTAVKKKAAKAATPAKKTAAKKVAKAGAPAKEAAAKQTAKAAATRRVAKKTAKKTR